MDSQFVRFETIFLDFFTANVTFDFKEKMNVLYMHGNVCLGHNVVAQVTFHLVTGFIINGCCKIQVFSFFASHFVIFKAAFLDCFATDMTLDTRIIVDVDTLSVIS